MLYFYAWIYAKYNIYFLYMHIKRCCFFFVFLQLYLTSIIYSISVYSCSKFIILDYLY